MKKIIFLVIALFTFSLANAQSNVVKVNPVGMIFGVFNATFEHAINENNSVLVGAQYFNWGNLSMSGLGVQGGYRFYFSKNNDAPEGIFASPFVSLSSVTYNPDGLEKETSFGISAGGKAGYQWLFDSGLALDLFFGYSYSSFKFDSYSYGGGTPVLGLAVGYNF